MCCRKLKTNRTMKQPAQISRRLTWTSKKKRGFRLWKIASMMPHPSRPGMGSSWKAKIETFRNQIA